MVKSFNIFAKSVPIDKYIDCEKPGEKCISDDAVEDLGYGDAAPAVKNDDLGYADPDDIVNKYEEAMYGYEEAVPTVQHTRAPRRSSLKSSQDEGQRRNRRASIGYSGEITLVMPTGKTVKRRTSLTFKDTNEVKEIEPVSMLTEEPSKLWFQKREYKHIKEKIYNILIVGAGKEETTRGLEGIVNKAAVTEERKEAFYAVLDEQERQRLQGQFDSTAISHVYKFHTIDSSVQARQRGDDDEADIITYTTSTRKRMMRRSSC